ncbi:phage integrase N-terminal SAM-like domain-containing protein [Thiohalobacter sp. IOR34]|uniref:phage integrase N-terminal SAM-like domain-containing protein n=1 Tax=Thiohalobacter sp. IOR34 TaxID=3057176 RepID=UPI0025B1CA99|nr:phage integrase N-terminal SAM-like domain-containing protein [Thiohalobacter sp. IOR34]WJW76175.1 phage integrase N-terminal SAM-like domain-containing protein [Thiohalobacter sp. IOR34]
MTGIRLLDQVRNTIRALHYSRKTEQAYCYWIRHYIRFHQYRHPISLCNRDVARFLSHLALERRLSVTSQHQAFNALVFLYAEVLGKPLGKADGWVRESCSVLGHG